MKRIINISTHSYVSMQQGLMSIQNMDSKESALVPIREINTIVFENPATVVTTRLLAELANAGITTLFCGADHMPAGMEIPLQSNLNSASISEHQFNAPKPLIKRLWKSIVRAKILNQASVMRFLGHDDAQLLSIASKVTSNDSTNREAVAAVEYFSKLVPEGGRWNSDYTAPLNYGYTIERAGIARAVCSAGLVPSKGIHHHNSLNPMNLCDDLIEPFRPIVDAIVFANRITAPLDHAAKLELLRTHETLVSLDGRRLSCQNAYLVIVNSFVDALANSDASLLKTPRFIGLNTVEVN